MRAWYVFAGLLLPVALWFGGCSTTSGGSGGQLSLRMGDAPIKLDAATVTAVTVEVTAVILKTDDTEGAPSVTLFTGNRLVNLLDLANKPFNQLADFGTTPVPAGHYGQLRLILGENNTVTLANVAQPLPLAVPSGQQTGIKIPLNLDIAEDEAESLLIDFNLAKFVQRNGNGQYLMSPTALRVAEISHTGSITGTITLPEGITAPLDLTIALSIVVPGLADPVTTLVTIPAGASTGAYTLHGILPGTYTLSVAVDGGVAIAGPAVTVTAQGIATADLTVQLPAAP